MLLIRACLLFTTISTLGFLKTAGLCLEAKECPYKVNVYVVFGTCISGGNALFDETSYLFENPDVALAVEQGHFVSGEQHYKAFGELEGRSIRGGPRAKPRLLDTLDSQPISRRDKLLAGIDPAVTTGVEIGALDKPAVTKDEGEIFYIDFATAEESRLKYKDEPSVLKHKIVSVDGIWGEQSLTECVSGRRFDYVVASHVVEHVPDLVTWLSEIASILKPGGELRLVVPDRRYTFDVLRAESRSYDILASYVERRRRPPARTIIEYHTLSRLVDSRSIWDNAVSISSCRPASSFEHGFHLAQDAELNGNYHDTHCWVFTPTSFMQALSELAELGLVPFRCAHLIDTEKYAIEFMVHMQLDDSREAITRSWNDVVLNGFTATDETKCDPNL